jgi:ubiquinone/menaquinone biosynthesis C-methylase UbiE
MSNTHFNEAAITWDENPDNLQRSKVIANFIIKNIPLQNQWNAMEIGCGTGILSFFLQPHLKHLHLVDDSIEMLRITNEKINKASIRNMTTFHLNLTKDQFSVKQDFIFSQMTFHHIEDIEKISQITFELLNQNGYICVADLVVEDGTFHSHVPDFNGHLGFDPVKMKTLWENIGFKDISISYPYTITKKEALGQKEFPLFLISAKKS